MTSSGPAPDIASPILEWVSADETTRISIELDTVDRIAGYIIEAYKSIPRRGAETGGLLLGTLTPGATTQIVITGFEQIVCERRFGPSFVLSPSDDMAFVAQLAKPRDAGILGFYRSHTRKEAGVQFSDLEFVDRNLHDKDGIALVVTPSGLANLSADVFFFQKGHLNPQPAGRSFRLLGNVLGGIPPVEQNGYNEEPRTVPAALAPRPLPSPVATAVPSIEAVEAPPMEPVAPPSRPARPSPVALPPFEPGVADALDTTIPPPLHAPQYPAETGPPSFPILTIRQRPRTRWELIIALPLVLFALGIFWWMFREQPGGSTQLVSANVMSLGLSVSSTDRAWKVSWDPGSVAAQTATEGILYVSRDGAPERISLTPDQLRAGAVTYGQRGDDLVFRLELILPKRALATETYHIVGRVSPPPATTPLPRIPLAGDAPVKGEFIAAEIAERVSPEVPDGVRARIAKPLNIDVRVRVNSDGSVGQAVALQHESGLVDFLANRAVAAAHKWTFKPARMGEKSVSSVQVIHFVFEP